MRGVSDSGHNDVLNLAFRRSLRRRHLDDSDYRAQYPAYACPCHRSTPSLAADGVWLRVGVVRYTFPVRLFHPLHSSRLLALSETRFPLAGYASAVRKTHPLDSCAFV